MRPHSLPALKTADAAFVTDTLLVGGDLDALDDQLAASQLHELAEAGVTHILDTRIEWSDEQWVADLLPQLRYLHHGMDDAGQRVPGEYFESGVTWANDAFDGGGTVLVHCHMGVNRGPSLGFAIMLAQGWDPFEALDAIRAARPIAWIAYADDVLAWHHRRRGTTELLHADRARLERWRETHALDLAAVIRRKREQGY